MLSIYKNHGKPNQDLSSSPQSSHQNIINKEQMRQVQFQRGFDNTFYYVERDETGESDLIKVLKISENDDGKGFGFHSS